LRTRARKPFVYTARGKPMTTSYWRLLASAYDDSDELKLWSALAIEAARRGREDQDDAREGESAGHEGGRRSKRSLRGGTTVIASKAKQPRLSRSGRPLVWVASLCSR
jgi:hypothetical protein